MLASWVVWQRIESVPFEPERLLAEIAYRLPGTARATELPAAAQQAFAEAGTLLAGVATGERLERARVLLESVLSAAPDHGGALRMYARVAHLRASYSRDPVLAREYSGAAGETLRRALHAEPGSAAAAAAIAGHLYWSDWDAAHAAQWYALARREAPQDAQILHAYAWYALAENQVAEAMQAMHAALALAPVDVSMHSDLGWFYFRTGHYADALRQCRVALQMAAGDESAQICEERSLAELDRADEAWQALRRHAPDWLDAVHAQRFDALGPQQAYAAAMHLAAQATREREGPGFDSACLEAVAGNREAALSDLQAATTRADPSLHLARVSPELIHLLGAPAVQRLVAAPARPARAAQSG